MQRSTRAAQLYVSNVHASVHRRAVSSSGSNSTQLLTHPHFFFSRPYSFSFFSLMHFLSATLCSCCILTVFCNCWIKKIQSSPSVLWSSLGVWHVSTVISSLLCKVPSRAGGWARKREGGFLQRVAAPSTERTAVTENKTQNRSLTHFCKWFVWPK